MGDVALVNEAGEVGTLPAAEAKKAIAAGGARPATPQEYEDAKEGARRSDLQERYGTSPLDMAGAKVAGVARGLTLGLSDPAALAAAEAFGGQSAREGLRERLSAYREVSPYLSGEGEAVGMALPMLVGSPGAAAAAGESAIGRGVLGGIRGLGAPARFMGAAGEAAEAAAARTVLAQGDGLAARLGAKALTGAARGAVEGGIYGAGHDVSEAALGDHELTAQKLVAGMGADALLGGIIGGGAGIAGELASTTRRAVADAIGERKTLTEWFTSMENQKAFKAAGGNYAAEVRAAENLPGGVQKIGADIAREVPKVTGKRWGAMSAEDVANALETRRSQVGEELGALRDSFDRFRARTGIGPSVDRFVNQARNEVIAPMAAMPGRTDQALRLDAYLEDFARKAGPEPTFKQWNAFRRDLDGQIKWAKRGGDAVTDALTGIRSAMEGEYEASAEEAARALGGTALEKHRELKSLYQSMATGAEMAERGLQRTGANRGISLTDTIAAGAGLMHGGPLGGAVMGMANKFVRSRGDMLLTDMFGGLSRLAKVERAAQVVDSQLDRAVRGMLKASSETSVPASIRMFGRGKGRDKAVQETVDRIAAMQADPRRLVERGTRLDALAKHAPQTAQAVALNAAAVAGFLGSRLPQGFSPMRLGAMPDIKYDDAEIAKFARTLRAATDPLSVLDDMKDGTLSREGVEAVKELYPKLYTDMQQRVMQAVSSPRAQKNMTYETRVRLGMLLDIPADATLDPQFIQTVQATFAKESQPPPQRAAGGGGAATVLAEQSATESERLTQG